MSGVQGVADFGVSGGLHSSVADPRIGAVADGSPSVQSGLPTGAGDFAQVPGNAVPADCGAVLTGNLCQNDRASVDKGLFSFSGRAISAAGDII